MFVGLAVGVDAVEITVASDKPTKQAGANRTTHGHPHGHGHHEQDNDDDRSEHVCSLPDAAAKRRLPEHRDRLVGYVVGKREPAKALEIVAHIRATDRFGTVRFCFGKNSAGFVEVVTEAGRGIMHLARRKLHAP